MKMIGMISLSSIAMSAYTDLVRLLKDDAMSGTTGKPTLKHRGDKAYWYAAHRVGTDMRFIYIGEDSDETRARIDRIEDLRATAKERQAARSRLVRLLARQWRGACGTRYTNMPRRGGGGGAMSSASRLMRWSARRAGLCAHECCPSVVCVRAPCGCCCWRRC